MSFKSDLSSCFVGTPLVINRQDHLRKSQVLDAQGRSRFHGAFEGGFSAGYYNSVGSAEGWKPAQYVKGRVHTVEDYMDEDDDALLGDAVQARQGFLDPLAAQSDRQASQAVWGELTASAIPGPVPRELLWFTEKASSSSAAAAAQEESVGKKLFLLCLSDKSDRKQRFLEMLQSRPRKPVQLFHDARGLGYNSTDVGKNEYREDADVSMWKKRKNLDDNDDDNAAKVSMSYHVVEVDEDDDDDGILQSKGRLDALTSRIMTREKHDVTKATWPDGIPLPTGFILARKHDPAKLLLAKKNACTPIPVNAPVVHDFGRLRAPTSSSGTIAIPVHVVVNAEDSKLVLSSRFVQAGGDAGRTATSAANTTGEFVRTVTSWIPNETTRKLFGVGKPMAASKPADSATIREDVEDDAHVSGPQYRRAPASELKAVLGRKGSDDYFLSSEDSELDESTSPPESSGKTEGPREETRQQRRRRRSRSRSLSSRSSSTSSRSRRKHSKKRKRHKSRKHRRRSRD